MANKITFPWFNPILSPNRKAHWAVKYNASKKQKNSAYLLSKASKPPKADNYPLKITFNPPDNRQRDRDNCLAAIKSLLDGMALAWGVNDKQFHPITIDFGDVTKGGNIDIEIWSQND